MTDLFSTNELAFLQHHLSTAAEIIIEKNEKLNLKNILIITIFTIITIFISNSLLH